MNGLGLHDGGSRTLAAACRTVRSFPDSDDLLAHDMSQDAALAWANALVECGFVITHSFPWEILYSHKTSGATARVTGIGAIDYATPTLCKRATSPR